MISVLRQVLGETRGENRYLVTVPGRGYRFVANVVRLEQKPETSRAAPSVAPVPRAHLVRSRAARRIALLAVAGALGAAVFAYGWQAGWWQTRESPASTVVTRPAESTPPPRSVAILAFESLSPDPNDEYVAFGLAESVQIGRAHV